NKLEIKFAQTRSNCCFGFVDSFVTSPRTILILFKTPFAFAFERAMRTASESKSTARTSLQPSFAAAIARIPEPVPMSKNDCAISGFCRRTISLRQNSVVGCWPVPKLNPGSRTTTAWFFRGRFLLQLGLISNESPIFMGLKCRFHDSAQSFLRTLPILILPGPIFNPQVLICRNPAKMLLRVLLDKIFLSDR
ncbi:MAG TPA: hypothetical protein VMD57_03765, partial [Candidatus Baltobacteraceae bacterium]|nr:hypothetical protein [Candidatus Baltobacteraceae bacterium]